MKGSTYTHLSRDKRNRAKESITLIRKRSKNKPNKKKEGERERDGFEKTDTLVSRKKTHLTFLFHITCKEIVSNVERPCDFSQPSTVCNQETYRIHGSDLRIFLFRPGEVSSMHFSPRPSCVFVSRSYFSLRIVSQGSNILREKKRRDAKPVSVVFDTKVLDFLQSFPAPAVTSFHLLFASHPYCYRKHDDAVVLTSFANQPNFSWLRDFVVALIIICWETDCVWNLRMYDGRTIREFFI